MKKKKNKKCHATYISTGKRTAWKICVWPSREYVSVEKVEYSRHKNAEDIIEKTVERWDCSNKSIDIRK